MELMLQNGDYVPDGSGGLRRVQGAQELLQRVLFKLTARRGSFPFLPRLGSELYRLMEAKPSAWRALARQYAAQALEGEELTVTDAAVTPGEGGALVEVFLDYRGEELSVTARV